MWRKALKVLGWTTLAAVLLFAGAVFAMFHHFNPAPPKASYSHPIDALEAQRQDLDYFQKLIALDRDFTPAARAEAARRVAELRGREAPLDHAHFRVALMQIVALADNGHSQLGQDWKSTPPELPVRVASFADGFYVMRATDVAADLLGGRVAEIDGKPVEEVVKRLETLRGGTLQWRRAYTAMYLSLQELLYGTDVAPDLQHSTWTVVTPAGGSVTRTLNAYTPSTDEPYMFVKRWLSSEPLKGMTTGWQAFQPDHELPVSLKDFDTTFRRIRLPSSCAMYLQYKSNDDDGEQRIRAFTSQTAADMQAHPPCELIMDLRYDDGGDYSKTAGFMRNLPKDLTADAHIYVLTGPTTFSAGITSAAFIKDSAGHRVTILGEAVGDRLQFFSEGGQGCLPNDALCVSYETGKHDYQHPCTDVRVCFWLNYLFPVRVESLDPDETIPLTFSEWRAGRDPVMERAMELATKHQSRARATA
jgi:hypothetical protein